MTDFINCKWLNSPIKRKALCCEINSFYSKSRSHDFILR